MGLWRLTPSANLCEFNRRRGTHDEGLGGVGTSASVSPLCGGRDADAGLEPPAWRCQQPVNVGTADVRARAPPGKRCCYGKEFLICRISGEDIKVKGGRWGGRRKRPLGSRLGSRAASGPVLGVKTETPPRECSPCQVPLRLRDLV